MSETGHPPGIPEITDEAGDTPNWVPLLGLGLLGLLAILLVFQAALADSAMSELDGPTGVPAQIAE